MNTIGNMMHVALYWVYHALSKAYDAIFALIITVLGYFSPIKEIVHMMFFFFLIDIYYGWRVDKKLNGNPFMPSKVWNKTVPKMLLSFLLVIASYMIDDRTDQHWVSTHKIVGWFLSSLIIISFARNGYKVTSWTAMKYLGIIFQKKVKDEIGVDVDFDLDKKKNKKS